MPDIESMARAAFERLHALADRPRNWDRHPDGDNGAELGRDTFREMVRAVYQELQQQMYAEMRAIGPAKVEEVPVASDAPVANDEQPPTNAA